MIALKVILSFVLAIKTDPGFVTQEPEKFDFLMLLEKVNPADLCPDC